MIAMKTLSTLLVVLTICFSSSASTINFINNDTIYHRYVNGSLSVKITPWENDRRNILLYNLQGEQTYQLEEIRMSYSVSHNITFAENGGVVKVVSHMNPGASRHWYQTTTTFDGTNQPLWQVDETFPMESVALPVKKYWHKIDKRWVRQEIVMCQPPQ
jgi:hypothetical protein